MPLVINKDGKQLGPYALDEARALVLSGELTAADWAWPDGATQWIRLKDVAGFSSVAPVNPAQNGAPLAPPTLAEQEIWRGHPSQFLNLGTYLFWTMVLLIALIALGPMGVVHRQAWSWVLLGGLGLVALVHTLFCYLHLRAVEYVVTSQRVRIISGLLGKDIQEIELFRVKDTMAHQSIFLRLCGLGTITIISGDPNHPRLFLNGIPHAIELREKLRQEIMILRQRFGVRELDVM